MSFNTVAPLPAHPVAAPLDLARRLRKEDKSRFGLAVGVSPGGTERRGGVRAGETAEELSVDTRSLHMKVCWFLKF